jgi:hypothetical protein
VVAEGQLQDPFMANFDDIWIRIERHAGQTFTTATGLPFTYRVPGDYLKVSRDGREIDRSLSRTNQVVSTPRGSTCLRACESRSAATGTQAR